MQLISDTSCVSCSKSCELCLKATFSTEREDIPEEACSSSVRFLFYQQRFPFLSDVHHADVHSITLVSNHCVGKLRQQITAVASVGLISSCIQELRIRSVKMPSTQVTKIIVLIVLLVSTFLFSMLPLLCMSLARRRFNATHRKRFDALMSLLSCYAAGVFLATCLLDLFPDVQDKLSNYMNNTGQLTAYPVAEFIMTCGMFLILTVEQLVLSCSGDHHGGDGDRQPLLSGENAERTPDQRNSSQTDATAPTLAVRNRRGLPNEGTSSGLGGDDIDSDWDGPVCDIEEQHYTGARDEDAQSAMYQDPNSHSAIRSMILLIALSLHSIFEGLAVGLQSSARQVLQIFAALALHKSILAFSLGLNLSQSRLSIAAIIRSNILFSITSPLGIGIGIAIIELTSPTSQPALMVNIILQGLACGTFLYIVFFEVLPHEFNSNNTEPNPLLKILFLIFGYATVSLLLFIEPSVVRPICQKAAEDIG